MRTIFLIIIMESFIISIIDYDDDSILSIVFLKQWILQKYCCLFILNGFIENSITVSL